MPKKLPDTFLPPGRRQSLYEEIDYKEYWNDPGQTRQDRLERHIISSLLPVSGHRIIDLGCGYGRLAPCYLDRFRQVVLFDGSISLLRQADEALRGRALLVAGDIGHLPFRRASFDHVLIIRVLQHVHDLPQAFGELRRITSREGQLLFSYHNKRNVHRIFHWLISRRIANPFSLESKEVSATLLSHHPALILKLIREAGFTAPSYRGAVVLNSLATITEKFNGRRPAGARWAAFTGRFKLAPWLIGRASAEGGEALQPGDSVEDLFQCPACWGTLIRMVQAFECSACHRGFPIRDGIVDFRI